MIAITSIVMIEEELTHRGNTANGHNGHDGHDGNDGIRNLVLLPGLACWLYRQF